MEHKSQHFRLGGMNKDLFARKAFSRFILKLGEVHQNFQISLQDKEERKLVFIRDKHY